MASAQVRHFERWRMDYDTSVSSQVMWCPLEGIFDVQLLIRRTDVRILMDSDGFVCHSQEIDLGVVGYESFRFPLPAVIHWSAERCQTYFREVLSSVGIHPSLHREIVNHILFHAWKMMVPTERTRLDVLATLHFVNAQVVRLPVSFMDYSETQQPTPMNRGAPAKFIQELRERHSFLPDQDKGVGDCTICLEALTLTGGDGETTKLIKLPCSHSFHSSCIFRWLEASDSCPLCRFVIT